VGDSSDTPTIGESTSQIPKEEPASPFVQRRRTVSSLNKEQARDQSDDLSSNLEL
jgi:hypothetical protein